MSLPSNTIDRIVANVLNQLGGGDRSDVSGTPSIQAVAAPSKYGSTTILDKVLTAGSFEDIKCNQVVTVLKNAIITPAAQDIIKERTLQIVRGETKSKVASAGSQQGTNQQFNCYVVKHTEALERAVAELNSPHKDLFGCPDDAAKAATSAICRGEAGSVLIFVEQVHRAACLANRNDKVKAVVVADSGDVKDVRTQLRANVWCINPSGRSYFELRNLLKTIST